MAFSANPQPQVGITGENQELPQTLELGPRSWEEFDVFPHLTTIQNNKVCNKKVH